MSESNYKIKISSLPVNVYIGIVCRQREGLHYRRMLYTMFKI